MKVDGFDIKNYGAKQFAVEIGHAQIDSSSEWLRGSVAPYFGPAYAGLKNINLVLYVRSTTRSQIAEYCSYLIKRFMKPAVLELDGFTHKFKATLSGTPTRDERAPRQFHRLTLPLVGYEYGDDTVVRGFESINVYNPGTMITPCRVELTALTSTAAVVVSGICRDSFTGKDLPVAVNNLVTNRPVIIDGLTGLVTENGALKEVDAWALPSLLPGNNSITCDSQVVRVDIKFNPFYL